MSWGRNLQNGTNAGRRKKAMDGDKSRPYSLGTLRRLAVIESGGDTIFGEEMQERGENSRPILVRETSTCLDCECWRF